MATQFVKQGLFWVLLFSLAATGSSYWDYSEYDYGVGYDDVDNGYYGTSLPLTSTCPPSHDDVDNGYYGTGVYNPSGVGHDPTTCPDCWTENGTYSGNRSINANVSLGLSSTDKVAIDRVMTMGDSSLKRRGLVDEEGRPMIERMRDLEIRERQRIGRDSRRIVRDFRRSEEAKEQERWEDEHRRRQVQAIYRDMKLKNPGPRRLTSKEEIEAVRSEVRWLRNNPRQDDVDNERRSRARRKDINTPPRTRSIGNSEIDVAIREKLDIKNLAR